MMKLTANQVLPKPEQVIRLDGVRWQTYQSLLLDFAEDPSKKLAFDQGILEIMTPLPEHEIRKGFLGRLVWATTEVMGLEVASLCSTTLSRQDLQKGIEPDECFYIEQEPLVRGKMSFDFEIDPVPDLAIAMDVTSSSLNRLGIYAALGVQEVWRFAGGDLSIYCLKDGAYAVQDRSQVLPILSRQVLLDFLRRRADTGENALLREFRQWLQAQG
jgi:Uma2 family endonuclease